MTMGISEACGELVLPVAIEQSVPQCRQSGAGLVPHSKNTTDSSGIISKENTTKCDEQALKRELVDAQWWPKI